MFSHLEPGQLRGEFSPAYLADPECAGLLHAHNPRMKLLCCFRNPVDAAYAGYYQLSSVQPLPDTFEDFLDRYPQLLEYGRYHHNLQPFLELFPREQMHLMLFDDTRTDPVAVYQSLCRFLDIDSSFMPRSLGQRVNPRTVLRSRTVRDLKCAIGGFMGRNAATRRVRAGLTRLGAVRIARKLFRLNQKPGSVPSMNPETRRRLVEFFRPDVEALGALLNRDLSHWSATPSSPGPGTPSRSSASEARSL